jgi:iron complex transport system ATP-binding protein
LTLIAMSDARALIGGRAVLQGASLSLQAGELVGLTGRNGAGKTSALRAMLGLLPLVRGSVRSGGVDLSELSASARAARIGYLPQERRIAWNMPVIEIVALATPFLDGEERRERAMRALVALAADHLADRGMAELSGGEKARVLIARAVNTPGQALLLDEPIAGLDPDAQIFVLDQLRAEAGRGRGVLMTLHDLTAASRSCDRVAVLRDGRVISDASPSEALTAEVLREAFGVEATWLATPAGPLLSMSRAHGA